MLLLSFLCQIVYWIHYGYIAGYRNRHKVNSKEQLPPISVIVVVEQNDDYIENGLPLLLEQEHPNFEVVVVNDCGGIDVDLALGRLSKAYSNLRFTTIKRDVKFVHSHKTPLTIGIKAAKYENIVITNADSYPTNEKWLSYISRGLAGTDLVIGYTGFEIKKDLANRIIRSTRLSTSIRYLRASISSKPYRGIYNNIAYTKTVFFANKGYTHLSMTIGEDDMYVQKIARTCAANVIINPRSTMRQNICGGLKWWWSEQRYRTYSYRYFPLGIRIKTFFELLTTFLFFVSTSIVGVLAIVGLVSDPYIWGAALVLLLIRQVVFYISIRRIARRLGEFSILWSYMLYDILSPIYETVLCLSRRLSPPVRVWIQNLK